MSPDRINLYWFLRPMCPVVHEWYARCTLCNFVRNPRHCIPEANVCDVLWQYLPYLLWKFRLCSTPFVRHFGPTETWERWQWDSWKIYINMDDTPLEAIDEEIWHRCHRQPPSPYLPYNRVLFVETTPSFIEIPLPTVGYLVQIPVTPRPWPG
ncbi:unnamed protein product [Trypanosoma congolense IL3000]|uniref:WGS project CAEQ00000000 data, annotated contig 49 n=1 Tax=Trypanosoma congolense (strain IL3000) TaxID=1068625 RepID=F9WGE2_TRYCI|nr:unnamed protein product [Trypanosoma congolense IL3000]